MVILEDVDLVAEERGAGFMGENPLLFELLNEMDGLAEDADVIFACTTNRPDLLEPALAARPGRVDQATEIPLPDADCRRRLISLYGKGLYLRLEDVASIVARTDGTSASFIKELLRRATLLAAEEGGELVLTDRHVFEALDELLVAGGTLTMRLLAASRHRTRLPRLVRGHRPRATKRRKHIVLPGSAPLDACGVSTLRWVLRHPDSCAISSP